MEMSRHGPEVGHPILRRRNRPGREFRPWWVVIGRSAADDCDEVWTQSKKMLRAIRSVLDPDASWIDRYYSPVGNPIERGFVMRSVAERELNEGINKIDPTNSMLNWTMVTNNQWANGQLTERMFDLLVADGVLRNPTVREFRPVASWQRPYEKKPELTKRSIDRAQVWAVDQGAADLWLSTRLLLLEDNQ